MQTKVDELERRIERLEEAWLDQQVRTTARRPAPTPQPRWIAPAPDPAAAAAAAAAPTPTPTPPKPPQRDALEDLIGGRVLAWAGGLAVVAAVVFLFAMAVSRGWLDEAARTVLGGAFSLALAAVGVWLQERGKRSDAALAAMAAGAAGLFVTVMVATRVYDLVPAGVGIGLALLVGAATTVLAVRWQSPVIGALGLIGGLLSPALAGAPIDGGTVAVLAATTLAASVVCLGMRWTWLSCATLALPAAQWVPYLLHPDRPGVAATVATLLAFGALGVAAAAGYDLRTREQRLPLLSAWLVAINALLVTGVGWWSLSGHSHAAADAWLVSMAIAHLALGYVARRSTRCGEDLSLVAFALAMVTADVALARLTDGVPTVFGWLGGALLLGAVTRHTKRRHELSAAELGLGAHIAVAIVTALSGPASPMTHQTTAASAAVLLALAATCLVTGRLVGLEGGHWRVALDGIAIAAIAYLTSLSFDGPALVVAWSVEAVTLAGIARRTEDPVAAVGAVVQLGLVAIHALAFEAPIGGLFGGDLVPLDAGVALGAFAAACLLAVRLRLGEPYAARLGFAPARLLVGAAAIALLHLTSLVVVDLFETTGAPISTGTFELPVYQQAQMALSATWAIAGVGALIAGLLFDVRPLRLGALALLGVAAGKVFIFDLASLDALYRVGSFFALGLLLLIGAFAWQRIRPRPLPDLRTAPPAAR